MSDNWSLIKHEVSTYRDYVSKLPAAAQQNAKFSYLLTKEEITRLLSLKGDGSSLDGIRIYLGANEIEHKIVPTVHVVASVKENDQFVDFNVPKTLVSGAAAPTSASSTTTSTGGSTGTTAPCPNFCGGKNILNP